MLHLPTDRLAELGDEVATPEEAVHLALCAHCAHERAAYQSLVAMALAEREPFGMPLTRWDAIAAELPAHVGAAFSSAHDVASNVVDVAPARRRLAGRDMLQIAAGVLLIAGGAVFGRVTAGAPPLPGAPSIAALQAAPGSAAALATDSATFASVDAARFAQQQSELTYQQAAAFLARFDTTAVGDGSPVAYRSRLAALDRVISTTREAMRDAPHDPVINGYYLTTLGQREETLRQLNTALPATLRVNSF